MSHRTLGIATLVPRLIAPQAEAEGSIIVPYLREAGLLLLDQVMPAGASMTGTIIASGRPLLFQTSAEYEERVQS